MSEKQVKQKNMYITDIYYVMRKDLRIEWKAGVIFTQVIPFGLLVILLFAFALDPDRGILLRAAPGLYWTSVLLTSMFAMQRSFMIEAENNVTHTLRMGFFAPSAIFFGKMFAITIQLLITEILLGVGVYLFYGVSIHGWFVFLVTILFGTLAISAAGTVFGALSSGLRSRETLLPLLAFPILSPVLLSVTRATEAAFSSASSEGWSWVGLLFLFTLVYTASGAGSFGTLVEEL